MAKWYNNYNNAMKSAAVAGLIARQYGSNAVVGSKAGNSSVLMARRARRKPRTFSNAVKKVLNRGIETKLNSNSASTTLTHATIYTYNLTAQISQGTADGSRLGDQIELKKLRLNLITTTPATAGAYAYRVLVLYSGEEANPGTWSSAGLSFADIFLPNALINTGVASVTNPKAVTVVYDQMYDINSLVASTSDLTTSGIEVDIQRKFDYQASGSVYGKKQNLFLICIPYVAGGTGGSTACGGIIANWCVHYKDA